MKNRFEKFSKLWAVFLWLLLLINSSCKDEQAMNSENLKVSEHFAGNSVESKAPHSILSDILFTNEGDLATLERDTGRITIFRDGLEKRSFVYETAQKQPIEATAFYEKDGIFSVLNVKDAALTRWTKTGKLVAQDSIVPPVFSNRVAFSTNGDFYSSAEGVRQNKFILHYDERGQLLDTLGTNTAATIRSSADYSIAQELAQGRIPDALQDSILLATKDERVYVLHRSKPILQCYAGRQLLIEKPVNIQELAEIREAVQVRNRVLTVENHYIPLSYWNDFAIGDDGSLFVLLALQTRPVIYKLSSDGEILGRFTGEPGKGHLLAVAKGKIAVADALSGLVTVYAI
ncbi:MAG: hypothetical protein DWQ10_06675, partial [Calditrichaeota bacterium]